MITQTFHLTLSILALSDNCFTGETALKEVLTVYVHEVDDILHLYTSCGDIDTTTNHPFYVIDRGWVAAGDLVEGDEIYLLDGSTAVITGSELEKLTEPIKVYNFEVEDFHTYFVGESSVLVHNTCYTNKELIDAANEINNAQYNGHPFASKMNPISVTATSDGQIIVSKNRGIPGKLSRVQAKAIFGDDVIIVGGRGANYDNLRWGYVTDRPWHAEARAVQYMNANGISTVGARQATTLSSCGWCAKLQEYFSITNLTGVVG